MEEFIKKKAWLWQNLINRKCPKCDARMLSKGTYFVCPNPNPDLTEEIIHPNCFIIKKTTAVEMLMNENHPANICLSQHQRETLAEAIKNLQNVE